MNLAFQTQLVVKRQYPDETVLFSTIATILETRHKLPIGWSPRRFFQRRGNVVITDARIFIQSSFLSLITAIWIVVIGCGLYFYVQNANVFGIVMAVFAAIFIIQRRPYSRDLPFNSIRHVHFGAVRGLVGHFNIVSIVIGGRAIQLVTAQHVPNHIREQLTTLDDSSEHH
ncbi:hypothetical protein C7293_06085 [filamentous cyanobacterium CCT1]|nr:hypothetical protein C7293_06085 [filamentous cyanobacterium CCT1]PSN81429.1 hypothetical protein C8B47_01290 [filamentous cyanobacterium CCP4]